MPETIAIKGFSMNDVAERVSGPLRRKIRRYSPTRLLRQGVVIGEITVSAERYKGRLRVESAGGEPRGRNASINILQT
jgi:hypothetical protein